MGDGFIRHMRVGCQEEIVFRKRLLVVYRWTPPTLRKNSPSFSKNKFFCLDTNGHFILLFLAEIKRLALAENSKWPRIEIRRTGHRGDGKPFFGEKSSLPDHLKFADYCGSGHSLLLQMLNIRKSSGEFSPKTKHALSQTAQVVFT